MGASERLFNLMDRKPEIDTTGGQWPAMFEPVIEMEGVSFRYPSRPENQVLQDASFKVPRGSVVALVGPSGGGKSTIVGLIERFYDVEKGLLKVGGFPIKDVDPRCVAILGRRGQRSTGDNVAKFPPASSNTT